MTTFLVSAGVLCMLAALVGGGIKLTGAGEMPVINSAARQFGVFILGLALLAAAYVTRPNFRVTDASITADQQLVMLCPTLVTYTAVVSVAGSSGSVDYRFVRQGQPGQVFRLEFTGAGSKTVQQSFRVESLRGLPRLGPEQVYLEILAPTRARYGPATTTVQC